jgi:hypothetical protein
MTKSRGEFLIFWASTIPGRFAGNRRSFEEKYNHRIYCTTTKDFVAFTPTRLFYDPGFSVIDATFLRADGKSWLIVKDETRNPPRKHLRMATVANDLPRTLRRAVRSVHPVGVWSEGPTAIKSAANTSSLDAYHGEALQGDALARLAVMGGRLKPDEISQRGTPCA